VLLLVSAVLTSASCGGTAQEPSTLQEQEVTVATEERVITLPEPRLTSDVALEEALAGRRSVREYTEDALDPNSIGQLLWAAQGITNREGKRTAPSAGATYPLEVYVVTADGVFRYQPGGHLLVVLAAGDRRSELAAAALDQEWVAEAPAVFVITVVVERTAERYGDRAGRYVDLEAGHAAQNLLLEAVALGLGAVPVGAFYDDRVQSTLGIPADHAPRYLIPVGRPRD
jgi:SagB-type dehydrogenase family enzyme